MSAVQHWLLVFAGLLIAALPGRAWASIPIPYVGDLALHRTKGYPMFVCKNTCIHLDWQGGVQGISPASWREYCSLDGRSSTALENALLRNELRDLSGIGAYAWGYIQLEPMPGDWKTPIIVNTVNELPQASRAGDPNQLVDFHAYCFDAETGQLLADFDLDLMVTKLYGCSPEEITHTELLHASIGPAGGIALAVRYELRDPIERFGWEVGIWDEGEWIPLAIPQARVAPYDILLGPNNEAVVYYGGVNVTELRFYDDRGKQLTNMNIRPRHILALINDWRTRTMEIAASIGAWALLAVSLLGLVWWFGPLRRAARAS